LVQAPQLAPVSLADLMVRYPNLRRPVIHGLLRRGETMNVISAPKIGKALAADTPILTEDGWKTMAELQPGMKVHAADGTLTPVVAVSEIMHGRPCYRVTTRSGASVVADRDHLWQVMQGARTAVVTTEELAAGPGGRRWLLPINGALVRDEARLPLDPWLLG
jgi:replicative DNA helicase